VALTILKNISQWGWDYPIYYGKIKAMFETTNQMFLPVGLWVKIKDPQKKQRRADSLHVGA
jgi:hypothetical protein